MTSLHIEFVLIFSPANDQTLRQLCQPKHLLTLALPLTRALQQNGGGGAAVLQGAQSVMHEPKSYIPGCIKSM